MPFHDRDRSTAGSSKRAGPQSDHHSRAARLRLFFLVGTLMAVLVAMNEARKPATWGWLWRGERPLTTADSPVNTRLPPQPDNAADLPGTISTITSGTDADTAKVGGSQSAAKPTNSPTDLLRGGWEKVWETLNYEEKNQLAELIRTARCGQNPSKGNAEIRQALAKKLGRSWEAFFSDKDRDTLLSGTEVSAEKRRTALQALTELEITWNTRLKPAFEAASKPRDWTAEERKALTAIQPILDVITLDQVRDDTVWRGAERTAWFRIIERLQQTEPTALARQSVGTVGFIQIFRQAAEYRGKVVTVRGTSRLAYRVAAPKNELGVDEYCLFWLRPEDGSHRPIVVYALHPPENFPTITREQQQLNEQVEVTGFFFKRWVYRAADGLNSAPLIVASTPRWFPKPGPQPTSDERLAATLGPYFWPVLMVSIAGMIVGVVWVLRLIQRSSRSSRIIAQLRAQAESAAAESGAWSHLPGTPSIEESLKQLEARRPDGEGQKKD